MPTEVIKTLKSSGGDYSTLAAWESGEQANLTALDRIAVLECYGFEETVTSAVTIAGWTTSTTQYIHIRLHPGAALTGKWNTDNYRLKVVNATASGVEGVIVNNTNVFVDDLQVNVLSNSTGTTRGLLGSTSSITFRRCIARGSSTGSGEERGFQANSGGSSFVADNCLAYDLDNTSSVGFDEAAGTLTARNCGAQNCAAGFESAVCTNCWAQDCTDGFVTANASSDYNLSDVAADAPGANSLNSTTLTFKDKANDDFSPVYGDANINAGTDLSANFTSDIRRHPRFGGGTYDMGPFEYSTDQPGARRLLATRPGAARSRPGALRGRRHQRS